MSRVNIKKMLKPSYALISYSNGSYTEYVESCEIKEKEGKYVLGPRQPATLETVQQIARTLKISEQAPELKKEIFPKKLLYFQQLFNGYRILWYRKSALTKLYFAKQTKLENCKVKLPGILFDYDCGSLKTYCFLGTSCNINTKLYVAPFYNQSENGSVCLGSSKIVTSNLLSTMIKNIEGAFLKSNFTHTSGSNVEGNMFQVWKQAIEDKVFPLDKLIETKKTIKTIL